jgi:UDP-glucose 4-epimerase
MHYLVTGGAGFIGSHLVEALLAQGETVTVIDDCSTGSLQNLSAVAMHPQLRIIHGSACDDLIVDEACTAVEGIIHLAASVGVRRILEQRVASIVTNLRGTEVLLRAATAHGRLPIFLASSSEVYGKLEKTPFNEHDDSVLGSSSLHRWSYACSKLMDEFLALAYHHERKLPVTIGRFFNITGPRQSPNYGMVLPRFCAAAKQGKDIEVHGDGRQTRCFLHVKDCVAAVMKLLKCPAAVGQVVNIGGSQEIAIIDLAAQVIQRAGAGRVRLVPYQEAFPDGGFEDMRCRVPDVGRLVGLTGWRQERPLAAMIDDCWLHA